MFVACSIPAGFQHIDDSGQVIFHLNGTHVGLDPENLPRNGSVNNSAMTEYGYGITELKGDQESAFAAWLASTPGPLKDAQGKDAKVQFAPIATGAIKWNNSRSELVKDVAKSQGMSMGGLTDKDMPSGLTGSGDTAPPDKK